MLLQKWKVQLGPQQPWMLRNMRREGTQNSWVLSRARSAGAVSDSTLVDGNNPFGIRVTINNSNTDGVTGGTGLGNSADMMAGVDRAIPLSAIGSPTSGYVNVCAIINGVGHDFSSN